MHIEFIAVTILSAVLVQFYHMNKLNRKFIKSDQEFRFDRYWQAEMFAIGGNITFIILFCIAFPYAADEYKISHATQFGFYAGAGGIGVAVFTYALGRTEKYLKNVIESKTKTEENANDNEAEN